MPLPIEAIRTIRGYEPLFRRLLTRWLEVHMQVAGSKLTPEDISAGVAHVFGAITTVQRVRGGNRDKAMAEFREGAALSVEDAKHALCEMAT